MRHRKPFLLSVALTVVLASPTVAQSVVQPISGIGTALSNVYPTAPSVAVQSSVTSVTYAPPVRLRGEGGDYFEVTGTIQGIGWGGQWQAFGGPTPIVDITSHYTYDIPFVLRWHAAFDGTLVYYSHGRAALGLLTFADGFLGSLNEGRRNEHEGDFVSAAMLTGDRRHAYFAPNLGGLGSEGTFTMHALEGPHAGEPIAGTTDAVTARDLVRVAKLLLTQLAERPVTTTIGTGHSAGALIMQFLNSGQSMILDDERFGQRLFTGGNFETPYDATSGKIFDAFVAFAPAEVTARPGFAATAPMLMIGGQAEFAGLASVLYARRVGRAGGDLSLLRVYQVRNLPHNWREIVESTPNLNQFMTDGLGITPHAGGDETKPVVAGVIDRAIDWVQRGVPAPPSHVEGAGIDLNGDSTVDALAFPYANGGFTTEVPAVDDASVDTYEGFRFDTAFTGVANPYLSTRSSMAHEPVALSLPGVTCRLGRFEISGDTSTSRFVPFTSMADHWKNYGQYAACLAGAVRRLADTGLYDPAFAPDASLAKSLIR